MIVTLVNLPLNVKYSDIKSLVRERCGIEELIVDNFMPHENRTKKVTVGLADSEDAASFIKNMDGYYWNGNRLQVVQKAKSQSSANSNQQSYSGSTNSMHRPQGSSSGQNYRPQGSSSGQNYRPQGSNSQQKYRPEGRETSSGQSYRPQGSSSGQESKSAQDSGMPRESSWAAQSFDSSSSNMMSASVPSIAQMPMGYEGNNYQASFNQSAYYLMNQPAYANQITSATQKMEYQYPGIAYGNMGMWYQQQQSSGIQQSAQQGKEPNWNIDCDSARDSNRGSDRLSDDRQPAWNDNQGSEQKDYRDFNDRNSRGNDCDSRDRHGHDSRRRNDCDSRGRNDHDSRERSDRVFRGRNDRNPRWGNNRDSRNENEGESRWGNNSRRDGNRDSKYDIGHNSNRNSYHPDQAGPSRDRDSYHPDQAGPSHDGDSFNRNESKYSQPTRGEDSKWGPRDERNDRKTPPRAKRPHVSDFKDAEPPQKKIDFGNKKFKQPLNKEHFQVPTGPDATPLEKKAHLLRLQLSTELAKEILNDKRFQWEAPDRVALKDQLKVAIRRRIDIMMQDDYNSKMKVMIEKYKIKFNTHNIYSHFLLFRRILNECGGKMITKMAQPAGKRIRTRSQKAEIIAPGVFGNLKVDHRFDPPGQKQAMSLGAKYTPPIPPKMKTQIGKTMYPRTKIPKAKPQYAEEERKLQMAQRKVAKSLLNDDYVQTLLSAVSPVLAKAINEEIDSLIPVIHGAFADDNPTAIKFAKMGRGHTGTTIKRLLKINTAKRILGVKPIVVRIYANPMVKRPPLEQFLNKYNVSTLKRSVKRPYYVASLQTVEDHDKLCALHSTTIAGCQVLFKPFHFAGNKDKITDEDLQRQRRTIKREQLRHSELAIKHLKIENGFEQTEPEDDYMDKDIDSEYEDLQEIQEMSDDINAKKQDITTDIQPEDKEKIEEEADIINTTEEFIAKIKNNDGDVSCEEVEANISSVDLTKEDDIDEMIDNLNNDLVCLPVIEERNSEVTDVDDNVAEVNNESCDVNPAEAINISDINEDDLEDW